MEFPRAKRDGETKADYETELLAFLQRFKEQCLTAEFEHEPNPGLDSEDPAKAPPAGSAHHFEDSSASQIQPLRYKKTGGAADGAGNDYEHKMLSLVFLRMLDTGLQFQVASNMEAAGKFDDIVMRYRKLSDANWIMTFVQLKHKKNNFVSKTDFLGLSGDFSLIEYCQSYETMKSSKELHSFGIFNDHKIMLFTNAGIDDSLVFEVQADPLLDTGGKAGSFKEDGDVFKELCEWVDIKKALTELQGQVEHLSEEEVKNKIIVAIKSLNFSCKTVSSFKGELLKVPTIEKLQTLLTKLKAVKDKETFSSFLAKLQVYTNQAHESKLNEKIKEEVTKVWKCSVDLEADIMLHALQGRVKSWWQKDKFYLTEHSQLWLDIVKSQTETLSRSAVLSLTVFSVEFGESSLKILYDRINEIASVGGILNLRVDLRSAASSLKVHQTLAKFLPNENILQVNVKALLEREDDVLSAWATRWCRFLVVECDDYLDQSQAERISEKILKVICKKNEKKILVLVAPKNNELNLLLSFTDSYSRFNDNFKWNDLTENAKENILSFQTITNGTQSSLTLSDLVHADKNLCNKFDLEVISQFLKKDVSCGKVLEEVGKFFVTRRLKRSSGGDPFVVNSLSDVSEKVALLVAEPGMGKSTLITHLAHSAKNEDPSAWIVHIKLNDCVQYLKDINVDHINESAAKRFLIESSFNSGNSLEKLIFGALKHKLVVFVDGVDEVCPHYEEQVFKLLSFFRDMKFSRLWVASRPVFQPQLETTLKVESKNLVAFSEKDRNEFFSKVWMANIPSASSEICSEVTESLLTLLNNSLGKDNPILGVPLTSVMIAEIFRERLFSANGPRIELKKNEQLDVTNLYRIFVAKKFDLYCVQKKKTPNRELAANIDVEETLLKQMHHRHQLAALRVLFSREEIDDLQFEGKERFDQDLATYLKEVSDGREKLGIIDNVVDGHPNFIHCSFAEYFAATWLAIHFKKNEKFIERIIFEPTYKLVSDMFHHTLAENHTLHVAVLNRDLEATERYLSNISNNANVDEPDSGGRTALHLAVLYSGIDKHPDYITILEILIEKYKARFDVIDQVLFWSPLLYAERSGSWKALEILLAELGMNNFGSIPKDWPKPATQLMLDAARHASVFVVSYLVNKRGGNSNCQGLEGETMVHTAAEGGHVNTVKFLAKRRSNLDAVNRNGLTPFQVAADHGAYEVMAFLFESQASFNFRYDLKVSKIPLNTSLLCAAFAGSLENVQYLIIEMGACVSHQDKKGHTAAWLAMKCKHFKVMDWLLMHKSETGDTPLHEACKKGELEIVAFLLSRGGDFESRGSCGRTPLLTAATWGQWAVMKMLLKTRGNVECRDCYGHTPLHKAAWRGNKEAVELLLGHGADLDVKNNKGETPLGLARRNSQKDVVCLLESIAENV